MPGAVSGDIIKAVYIVKDQSELGRTPAMLSVLLDRIVGLMGLFLMGLFACLFNFNTLWSEPATRKLVVFLVVIVVCVFSFLALVYSPHKDQKDPLIKLFKLNFPGFRLALKIYKALRGYRRNPSVLFKTIGLSMIIQMLYLCYMWYLTSVLTEHAAPFGLLASVFPFGILVTAIPIAPGGLGVGNLAFDKLFSIVGLTGGANVFNVFAVGPLALNLIGFIPYLSVRSKVKIPNPDKVFV